MLKDQQRASQENNPPLNRRISFRISRLNARLNTQAARILSETAGISLSQWRILVVIDRLGISTASEIVRHTRLDKALISRTIKSLGEAGLISTAVDSEDLRAQPISMTSEGRARFEQAWPHMFARQKQMTDAFSAKELDRLFEMLGRLERTIDDMEQAR